jgi:hypothetical protein
VEEPKVQQSGLYADYRGRRLKVLFTGADWVAVPVSSIEAGPVEAPEAVQVGEDRWGAWAKLPKDALTRYVDVAVTVEWRGEQFGVGRVSGDELVLYGGSPDRAEELGLEGDQYMGFSVTVPQSEVRLVGVEEKEIT